jgi:hypothetical protein
MSITPIYFNILGDIVQRFSYCTINGSSYTSFSVFENIYGLLDIPDLVITDLQDFIGNSFAPPTMDLVDSVYGNVNGTMYDFKVYPTYTNIDSQTTENNIDLTSGTKNTVVIFSQVENPVEFANLVSGYETVTSFYLKVYDIVNDEIKISTEDKNVTIRLSKALFNIPTTSLSTNTPVWLLKKSHAVNFTRVSANIVCRHLILRLLPSNLQFTNSVSVNAVPALELDQKTAPGVIGKSVDAGCVMSVVSYSPRQVTS